MIPIETQIFRLIFPPAGAIPLEKIEAVPHIRQHINSIIDLASTEHGISPPDESAALTARVIELRDTPGPDGKVRTWRTIAEICGTTSDAVRHRYVKGKATIRKSLTVRPSNPPSHLPPPDPAYHEAIEHPLKLIEIQGVEIVDAPLNIASEWGLEKSPSESTQADHPPKTETEPLQEAELTNPEKPAEQENKSDEVATIREFRAVDATPENLEKLRSDMDAKKAESLDPKTLAEVDRMLGEGMGVLDIAAELEKKGKLVPWTKIRARAAYLGRMKSKSKEAKPEPHEAEATDDRPEPRSISRKELDLLMWDLHKAGKTLDEISDILYSKGLYYSPKSVRVRLLSQGAKL